MIEEANKISAKLRKNAVFSRYDKTRPGHSLDVMDSRQVAKLSRI